MRGGANKSVRHSWPHRYGFSSKCSAMVSSPPPLTTCSLVSVLRPHDGNIGAGRTMRTSHVDSLLAGAGSSLGTGLAWLVVAAAGPPGHDGSKKSRPRMRRARHGFRDPSASANPVVGPRLTKVMPVRLRSGPLSAAPDTPGSTPIGTAPRLRLVQPMPPLSGAVHGARYAAGRLTGASGGATGRQWSGSASGPPIRSTPVLSPHPRFRPRRCGIGRPGYRGRHPGRWPRPCTGARYPT